MNIHDKILCNGLQDYRTLIPISQKKKKSFSPVVRCKKTCAAYNIA